MCVDVDVCVCVCVSNDRACDEFTCARIYLYVLLPPRASVSCIWFSVVSAMTSFSSVQS
jgi:hypothetical protein